MIWFILPDRKIRESPKNVSTLPQNLAALVWLSALSFALLTKNSHCSSIADNFVGSLKTRKNFVTPHRIARPFIINIVISNYLTTVHDPSAKQRCFSKGPVSMHIYRYIKNYFTNKSNTIKHNIVKDTCQMFHKMFPKTECYTRVNRSMVWKLGCYTVGKSFRWNYSY